MPRRVTVYGPPVHLSMLISPRGRRAVSLMGKRASVATDQAPLPTVHPEGQRYANTNGHPCGWPSSRPTLRLSTVRLWAPPPPWFMERRPKLLLPSELHPSEEERYSGDFSGCIPREIIPYLHRRRHRARGAHSQLSGSKDTPHKRPRMALASATWEGVRFL
jgi:hypothetical protein